MGLTVLLSELVTEIKLIMSQQGNVLYQCVCPI